MAFAIFISSIPVRLDATNKTSPIGGVESPTVTVTHMTIAKCNGWIPRAITEGPRRGPSIKMEGVTSRNIPAIKINIITKKRMSVLLSVIPKIKADTLAASPVSVTIPEK